MISIFLSGQSKKREIEAFLDELQKLLGSVNFNIDTDFVLVRKKKQGDDYSFSTPFTLLDLNYDVEDIVERLKELTVKEYSETKFDKNDVNPLELFVFGKVINGKQVYVKIKIRDLNKQVVCVSFHYAKEKMKFPYA